MADLPGPYETETDTYTEPLPREIRAMRDAGRIRPGDPDRLVSGAQLRHLEAACTAAGVELGAYDRRIVEWLASTWEPSTLQVLVGLIARANQTETTTP